MLVVAGACLSSLRDYQGFVSPTTGWHPWLMTFMPSALSTDFLCYRLRRFREKYSRFSYEM